MKFSLEKSIQVLKKIKQVLKNIAIIILDWLGIQIDWFVGVYPIIVILYIAGIVEFILPWFQSPYAGVGYPIRPIFVPLFFIFIFIGTYWKRKKIYKKFDNTSSIIVLNRIVIYLMFEIIAVSFGLIFGLYSIFNFSIPNMIIQDKIWLTVFFFPNIISIIARGCIRESFIAGFFTKHIPNFSQKITLSKLQGISKRNAVMVGATAVTFILFYPYADRINEILKASICTSENIKNSVDYFFGHYFAGCNVSMFRNDYLFHMSGGGFLALLSFEFFLLSKLKQWRYGIILSLMMATYQFSEMIIETLDQDIFYLQRPLADLITLSITAACFVTVSIQIFKIDKKPIPKDWLAISIAIVVTISLIIGLVLYNFYTRIELTTNPNDLPNWLTLVIGTSFAFIITLVIFWVQSKNEKRLRKAVYDIQGKVTEDREGYQNKADAYDRIILTIFNEMLTITSEILEDCKKLETEKNPLIIEILKAKIESQQIKLSKLAHERLDRQIPNAAEFHTATATENYTLISNLCKQSLEFDDNHKISKISAYYSLQTVLPGFILTLQRNLGHV